jgi:hypothetical protein
MVSVCSGVLALCLLAGAARGYHSGSGGGTILLAGFGFLLLLTSVLVFVGGVVYLKSSKALSELNRVNPIHSLARYAIWGRRHRGSGPYSN